MARLFGTDGVRGEANRYPVDGATVFSLGQATILTLREDGCERPRVVIGRDTRVSGPMLESALAAGVASMGGVALLGGVLPTPAVAHATVAQKADAGAVISASHNPFEDNGVKLFSRAGFKLADTDEQRIELSLSDQRLQSSVPGPREIGSIAELGGAQEDYVAFLTTTFPTDLSLRGMKVVLDTANGAAHAVAPAAFRALGAEVTVIHDGPDGFNINERCGSQHTEDLQKTVLAAGAALGLAFDGDGDRLIAVDEKGRKLTGDQTLLICAKMLKDQGRLNKDLIVSTVMSNMGLHLACEKYELVNHVAQVGDRYVLEDMRRLGAVLGGEESGHMIFLEHQTTGDGILAGLQLVAAMLLGDRPLSELAGLMEVLPQTLINVEVAIKPPLETLPEIGAAVARAEAELGGRGRVLIRYSGTQNMCRVMVEGPSPESTDRLARELAQVVASVLSTPGVARS